MDDLSLRLRVLVNLVVPLVLFMACVYLALHVLFARVLTRPDNPMLWFFSVVTRPLTRPIAAMLPAGTPEGRVRLVALGVYAVLWIVVRVILRATLVGVG